MKSDKELITKLKNMHNFSREISKEQSLQEKTGATAEQIRQAIEIVGFDRNKVEEYLAIAGNNTGQ